MKIDFLEDDYDLFFSKEPIDVEVLPFQMMGNEGIVMYPNKTSCGQSGGPILITNSYGKQFVMGVHVAGHQNINKGTIFTKMNLEWIENQILGIQINKDAIGGAGVSWQTRVSGFMDLLDSFHDNIDKIDETFCFPEYDLEAFEIYAKLFTHAFVSTKKCPCIKVNLDLHRIPNLEGKKMRVQHLMYLLNHSQILILDLSENDFMKSDVEIVSKALLESKIEQLSLDQNHLCSKGLHLLFDTLSNTKITNLSLKCNNINKMEFENWVKLIEKN